MGFEISDAEVRLADGEEKRVKDAVEALKKDHHAPRELTVKVTLHVHHEYPKHLYKIEDGKSVSRVVNGEEEEDAATSDGFGKFEPADSVAS